MYEFSVHGIHILLHVLAQMSSVFSIDEGLFKLMSTLTFVDISIIFIIGTCSNKIHFVDNLIKAIKYFFIYSTICIEKLQFGFQLI